MLDIIGLLGLLMGLAAVFWLVAATLFRGPRRWVAWVAVVGLVLFFGNMMVPTSQNEQAATPQEAATVAPHPRQVETRETAVKVTRPQCSQSPIFTGDLASEFYDGSIRYSLMQASSFPTTLAAGGSLQTVWVFIGMKNERTSPVQTNPWFDLWLMPLPPTSAMPYPPQPVRVDLLEIGGPVPLPTGEMVLLDSGQGCCLALTFQLGTEVTRAAFNVGYVQAVSINLDHQRGEP